MTHFDEDESLTIKNIADDEEIVHYLAKALRLISKKPERVAVKMVQMQKEIEKLKFHEKGKDGALEILRQKVSLLENVVISLLLCESSEVLDGKCEVEDWRKDLRCESERIPYKVMDIHDGGDEFSIAIYQQGDQPEKINENGTRFDFIR